MGCGGCLMAVAVLGAWFIGGPFLGVPAIVVWLLVAASSGRRRNVVVVEHRVARGALVRCPDCGRAISDQARACPECGRPLGATTIERTGKRWRGMELVSMVAIVVGIIGSCTSFERGEMNPWFPFVGLAGVFCYVGSRIGARCEHG